MKSQYAKLPFRGKVVYEHKGVYYRMPRTHNERKQNRGAIADGYKVRGSRRILPSSWDDIPPSFGWGKCWKRFTKRRKQWND